MNFGRWENEWSVILCMRWKRISSLFHTKQPHHQYSIFIIFACKYQRSARITRVFELAYMSNPSILHRYFKSGTRVLCRQRIGYPGIFNQLVGYGYDYVQVRHGYWRTRRTLAYTRASNLVRVVSVCITLVVMLWYVFGLPQSLHNMSV